VEGLSKAKADVMRRILDEEKIDILDIQETHTHDQDQLMKRGTMPGYSIAVATYHNKYGNNIYKPLTTDWPTSVPNTINYHPAIYMTYFNGHHTSWKYRVTNTSEDKLLEWSEGDRVKLVHDAKQKCTFHSARWDREYNEDLCFISTDSNGATYQLREEF